MKVEGGEGIKDEGCMVEEEEEKEECSLVHPMISLIFIFPPLLGRFKVYATLPSLIIILLLLPSRLVIILQFLIMNIQTMNFREVVEESML